MKIRNNDVVAILGQVKSIDGDNITISVPDAHGQQQLLVVESRTARIIGRDFQPSDEVYWKNEKHVIENTLATGLFTLKRTGALEGEASSYVIAKSDDLTHAESDSIFRFQSHAESANNNNPAQDGETKTSLALLADSLDHTPRELAAPAPMRMTAAEPIENSQRSDEKEPEQEQPIAKHDDLLPSGMVHGEASEGPETGAATTETEKEEPEDASPEPAPAPISDPRPEPAEDGNTAQTTGTDGRMTVELPEEAESVEKTEAKAEPARQLPEESPIRQSTLENLKKSETVEEVPTKTISSSLDKL